MREYPCGCRIAWVEDDDELCVPSLVIWPCDQHRREAADRLQRRAHAPLN